MSKAFLICAGIILLAMALLLASCKTQPRYYHMRHHHHMHGQVEPDEPVFVEHEGKLYELR